MRVTHISIIHRALDIRIFEKQCRTLAAAGHDVHLVVAGAPAEEIDGVRLHSVAGDGARPPARRQWARLARAARWAFRLRPSVYHLHDPHLIPLGLLLKLTGARVVYDVHEDYPAHARTKLAGHAVRGWLKASMWLALEGLARRTFDDFVCASPALAAGFPAANTVVVGNFPLHQRFAPAPGNGSYAERHNRLIYTGVVSEIRGFREMVHALDLLPAELDCRLRVMGWFRPSGLAARARELPGSDRVDVIPAGPCPAVVAELLSARAGLILLHPLPNHHDAVRSNKLFEYMAAGLPVIASDLPRWREIVCGVDCGLVVDPLDPAAIAAAIEHQLANPEQAEAMGRRGREAVCDQFNWDADGRRLLSLYCGPTDSGPTGPLTGLPWPRGVGAGLHRPRPAPLRRAS